MINMRTSLIYDKKNLESIQHLSVLIVGLGGVGGSAFESLVRHGIKEITIIDFDKVDSSNINRQVLYTSLDLEEYKVDIAAQRAKSINPNVVIHSYKERFNSSLEIELSAFDYVIDAIDDMAAKTYLIAETQKLGIKTISSLGMGNRVNPNLIKITTLEKTEHDPLAKKLRSNLRNIGVNLKKVMVVASNETPCRKEKPIGSTYSCPNTAGILLAQYIINRTIEKENNTND